MGAKPPKPGHDKIADRFRYHPPGPGVAQTHEYLRVAVIQLAGELNEILVEGREKALALTALEEVLMRANQSVAMNQTLLSGVPGE